MNNKWKSVIALLIGVAVFALWPVSGAFASSLTLSVTPSEATANSVYTFTAVWTDDDGNWPSPVEAKGSDPGVVVLLGLGGGDSKIGGIPMYKVDGTSLKTGITYQVSVSAGLNLINQDPDSHLSVTDENVTSAATWLPDTSLNNLLWDPYVHPLWYAPKLRAYNNGIPYTVPDIKAHAWGKIEEPEEGEEAVDNPVTESSTLSVVVHDSRYNLQPGPTGILEHETIDYGGSYGDRDWLSAGAPDIDPLTVEPSSDGSGITGDDGSASHEYVFRVRYRNRENRPPMAWWHSYNFSPDDFMEDSDWGVALYLDVLGIGDYRLIPMRPEAGGSTRYDYTSLTWTDPGQVFIARLLPNDGMAKPLLSEYDGLYFPSSTCWAYNSLPVGAFNYFFACSDDWLRFTANDFKDYNSTKDFPRKSPFVLEYQPNLTEWGLDPSPSNTWTVPAGYDNTERLKRLNGYHFDHTDDNWDVRDTIDWTTFPFDATDDLWSTIPWGLNGSASDAPDFTTVPFGANNNPLDPINARAVTGIRGTKEVGGIDRSAHRSYSTDGRNAFDSTLFVDRPVLVPGKFDSTYTLPATEHPVVGAALTVPVYDDVNVSYRDTTKYGGGRYYGTLLFGSGRTFKRALNPQMDGTYLSDTSVREVAARRAETAGATTSTLCTFRIMYKSKDGKGPAYVRLLLNNTSSRGCLETEEYPDVDGDGWPGVTMQLENSSNPDYVNGAWFIAQRTITTSGPYHYLFEASDGNQKIIWPRRPDYYEYSGQTWGDWWVPTLSTPDDYFITDSDTGDTIVNPDYDNNDFVPGPYINSKPQLSDWSVTPTSGKQGDNFKFRVLYKDADGQRPYSTKLILETSSSGTQRVCQMLPESVLNSNTNNSAKYKAGVYYYFNTATDQDLVMETGTRRYKFQFSDDWGRQVEYNDRIEGETNSTSWISNLTITSNYAPTLYDGSVEAADGTSNSATLWTFNVTYADQNNDAPAIAKVFIGLLQPDGKTILWDDGHDMAKSDSSDVTYTNGALYYYQTRLTGIENAEYETAKQYYYAFLFKDAAKWATYKSTSSATTRSNSANCITSDLTGGTLVSLGSNQYKIKPMIAQQATVNSGVLTQVTPSNADDIVELSGVYLKEDLDNSTINNINYYTGTSHAFAAGDTVVYLGTSLPSGTTSVWLKYQSQSPIVGPIPDSSASGISDAIVYDNGTEMLLDNMKSGWQGADDERYSIMPGVALDTTGNSSVHYVVPEDTSIIASVEGVFTSLSDVNDSSKSYYDPASAAAGLTAFRMGDSIISLTDDLPTAGQRVFIKYYDTRFTNICSGTAQQNLSGVWTQGTTYFSPDGWQSGDVHIKSNSGDATGGVLGVWTESDDSINYFDPFITTYTDDPLLHLELTYEVPSGTDGLWARYYQKGDYNIDRWNRIVQFKSAPTGPVTATYMFGTRMSMTVGANTAPTLSEGSVTPSTGTSTTEYTYKVKYTDTDGASGQAPEYVVVYIDGVACTMTQVISGTPLYREGTYYSYKTSSLGPKDHTYRFEASDGADVAIYDYYTKENEDRPDSGSTGSLAYIDLEGPYVNDPPQLLSGAVSPTGTIAVDANVTFTVTYKDPDSDPPYFFDKTKDIDSSNNFVGADVSGSPRLWIDTTDTDTLNLGKVVSLNVDPLLPTKNRIIVATDLDGNNPNWTTDEFAGMMMQVTSGSLIYTAYLIQSNTANTITVATDKDLGPSGDNLSAGSTFTINGLLMIRQDATDYSLGTQYKLTIPKLAVGSHYYRFTARSRVTKPQWLLDIEDTFQPYSDKVYYPTGGSGTGPTVKSTVPTGNVAPVLENTTETSLYKGPYVSLVTVDSTTSASMDTSRLGNWTTANAENIREVLGVYLTDPSSGSPTNYYDTTQTFDPTTSKTISLSPALASMPSNWVQTGTVSSLNEVVPDSISTIASLVGVYDNVGLTGTNYLIPEGSGTAVAALGTSTIKLSRNLPESTSVVYIVCKPTMYLKYYENSTTTTKFLTGEPITFAVNYSDADNDPPTYHDGVQGYLKLVFGSSTTGTTMQPVEVPADYYSAVPFQITLTDFSEGTVKYHFEGSDGYDPDHKVRFPASSDYTFMVNYKPTLTSVSVVQEGTVYNFYATYKDLDGGETNAPTPTVQARLTNLADATEYLVTMEAVSDSPVYSSGAQFAGAKDGLESGTYSVVFEANDGYQDAASVTYQNIVVRDPSTNTAPQITSCSVSPSAGKLDQTFVYTATYVDADGDAPVVASGTDRLNLVIDKGLSTEKTLVMTRTTAAPADYASGATYKVSTLGSNLGIGDHTYYAAATDGIDDATTLAAKSGPVILQPFITNLRFVDASEDDPDTAAGITTASVGDNVLIVGRVKFPINTVTGVPADGSIEDVAVKVTKPDGTQLALVGKVTMATDSGGTTVSTDGSNWIAKLSVSSYPAGADTALITGDNITLCASGTWKVNIVWAGNDSWDSITTDSNGDGINDNASVVVGGPMRTVAVRGATDSDDLVSLAPVVDMICPPMKIGSGEPGALFGYTRSSLMQIVRWIPEYNQYYWYGVSGTFPTLKSGEAVWIKPKSTYPTDSVSIGDYQTGMLALGNPDVSLDYSQSYRLIKVFSKAYDTQANSTTGETEYTPCTIQLSKGWNQFGNIFFNWKKDASGNVITPKEDVGIPISEVKVSYLSQQYTLSQAASAGLIRDYAWRWDAADYKYVLVSATYDDDDQEVERVLKAWSGYWIKALVDCKLIINPNTSYNGVSSSSVGAASSSSPFRSESAVKIMKSDSLDMPPLPE